MGQSKLDHQSFQTELNLSEAINHLGRVHVSCLLGMKNKWYLEIGNRCMGSWMANMGRSYVAYCELRKAGYDKVMEEFNKSKKVLA